jgi:hypothetical protein
MAVLSEALSFLITLLRALFPLVWTANEWTFFKKFCEALFSADSKKAAAKIAAASGCLNGVPNTAYLVSSFDSSEVSE